MGDEFGHLPDVGSILTEAEYDSLTGHRFDSQATGDIMIAVSAVQLARLAAGIEGYPLIMGASLPQWGGKILLKENAGLDLNVALSGDGKYSGIVEAGTAGVALAFGDIVYLANTGKWLLAKADVAATSKDKLGMVVFAAVGDTDPTIVLLYGKIRAATLPALTVGAPVHISAATAGDVVVAAPAGTEDFVVRIIGYGATAEDLFFCPDNTYIELAAP